MTPSEPGNLLQRIVAAKQEEIAARLAECSLPDIRARALDAPPTRDFLAAVTAPGRIRLIAEVKKASPSRGVIRADFHPAEIARAYQRAGADALSVLTDEPFFQGSLPIFSQVRQAVDLPLLRKDFMIHPYQFYEARAIGADAVLLITSILSDSQLAEFFDLARRLELTVLVETHSQQDIRRALATLHPHLLGINNRDLEHPRFQTDIRHTADMIPLVHRLAPPDIPPPPIVSESGIHTPDDVARLRPIGVRAILVGESLMRQPDIESATRALMARAATDDTEA